MWCLAALLLLAVTVASNSSHEQNSVGLIKTTHQTSGKGLDLYQSDSLHPLRRTKRRWVITTIQLEEEDKGPFPKLVGELANSMAFNMSLIYSISGPGVDENPEFGLFSVEDDANGHLYVHRTIDREKTPSFEVCFDVAHRVTGEIVDRSLIFIIKIKDINDNSPKFPKDEFNITIKESHNLNLCQRALVMPFQSETVLIFVVFLRMEDIFELFPVPLMNQMINNKLGVPGKNSEVNTQYEPVFQVTALDKDEENTANSRVTYSLLTQTPNLKEPRFNINPTSCLIMVSGCLEYKTARSFKLLIKARDHGTPQMSSTATVNIAIEDTNNHLPAFTKENYQLQISEGKVGPGVLRLQVEDEDSPNTPAWRAKYKIEEGNEKKQFIIETDPETNEGILNIIKPLDFEEVSEKRLVISVENEEPFSLCHNGKPRNSPLAPITASVGLKVLDINDAPEFHLPLLLLANEEGVKPGTKLGEYMAVDPDVVPNKIKYKIVYDPAGWMTIDENTGVLTARKELDRESPYVNNSIYPVIVHAIDNGVPPQTGTGTIQLYLSDINDHVPTLVTPSLEVCDKEKRNPLIIKAADNDSHLYAGPFTFKLADDSKSKKQNWRLGKSFGDSVELLMLRSLPHGKYVVPLLILDRQGLSRKQNLFVRLCRCHDGNVCEEPNFTSLNLGGGAIAVMLAAFLLLLVAVCLLLRCSCGSQTRKSQSYLPSEEGNQTLIKYNEESGNILSQVANSVTADDLDYATQISVYAEVKKEKQMSEDVNGMVPSPFLTSSQGYNQVLWDAGREVQSISVRDNHSSQRAQYYRRMETLQRRRLAVFVKTVGEKLNQRLYHLSDQEENIITYQPHIYAEEGKLERSSSLGSLLTTDHELPEDFLDTLGPKFAALDEICWKSFQSKPLS